MESTGSKTEKFLAFSIRDFRIFLGILGIHKVFSHMTLDTQETLYRAVELFLKRKEDFLHMQRTAMLSPETSVFSWN